MTTLAEMLRQTTSLEDHESEWLHLLAGDWQLIADLSFADLVLWVRGDLEGWRAVAHVRPNTGPMVFYDDIVGSSSSRARAAMLDEAARTQRVVAKPSPTVREDMSVREDAVPVYRSGRVIAVVTRHTNLTGGRTPSRLELTYRDLADALLRMVAAGDFPSVSAPTGMRRGAPRVGDGVIHLDVDGVVRYASPNAVSAVHRMGHVGDVIGEVLAQVVADVASRSGVTVDESLAVVVTGRAAWRSEVETESATITMRAIPLIVDGERTGAMVLMRDVSELRRREHELLTKDATIREIHHRVKNNLQTVASLLRLQARAEGVDPGKALADSVTRILAIAAVHEELTEHREDVVDLAELVDRLRAMLVQSLVAGKQVTAELEPVTLAGQRATALALVFSELLSNALEHGGDRIAITLAAREHEIVLGVADDGAGLADAVDGTGMSIVRALVRDELGGTLVLSSEPGLRAEVRFPAER